jgi:NADH-quinone oxidoreductase subunit E
MNAKILIIDDDFDFIEATKLLLESKGYRVITALNGQEGFAKIKNESPDLILLDMMMTYKTEGAETAKTIAEDASVKDVPVILITGARREAGFPFEIKPDKKNLPVKAVIEKPINPESFLKLIQETINKKVINHSETVERIEELAKKWKAKRGNLVMILHEIQNFYGYVPRNVSFELSRILDIPMARIYEVITFYNFFKLDKPGRYTISLCMGTACYLKGAPGILEELKKVLNVEEGQTTKDGLFYLQVVRCLGCCGLAPVLTVDEKVYGKVKRSQIINIISEYIKKDKSEAGQDVKV